MTDKNSYELMLIIDPMLESSQSDAVLNLATDAIKNLKGEITNVDKWGRKKLSYKIKNFNDGVYVVIHFTGLPDSIEELNRIFKINESVVRHMVIRLNHA